MKPKQSWKLAVDLLMTAALLVVMGYQFWGEAPHEWVGAGLLVLFVLHHLLNANWHRTLFRGSYTPLRAATLVLDFLILLAMLAQGYSGIRMSRFVFPALPDLGGMALARRLHILGAYWGFLLIGLHLGLHWEMVLAGVRRALGKAPARRKTPPLRGAFFAAAAAAAAFGARAFVRRDFPTYLLLRSEFVFLDYGEPPLRFYLDYLALLALCILLGHCAAKLLKKASRAKREQNPKRAKR